MINSILKLKCEEFTKNQNKKELYTENIIKELKRYDIEKIYNIIKNSQFSNREINSGNIPQISSFENATVDLLNNLNNIGDIGIGYEKLGYFLIRGDGKKRKKTAYYKYGENHFKLSHELGITKLGDEKKRTIYLSPLGKKIIKMNKKEKLIKIRKLCFRIPIIQRCIKKEIKDREEIALELQKTLARSTARRRASSVKTIMRKIEGD